VRRGSAMNKRRFWMQRCAAPWCIPALMLMLSLLRPLATAAAIPPLPPLPDTLPTDQFAIEMPPEVGPSPDSDTAWLAPAQTVAPSPAIVESPPPLEGPPTPLAPLQRLSHATESATAATAGMAAPAATAATAATDDGKPISLNLKNADLSAVVQSFAKFSGLNIVASEKI